MSLVRAQLGEPIIRRSKMVAKNDITGDAIQTKGVTNAYRDNYDNIFKKDKKTDAEKFDEQVIMKNEYYDLDGEGDTTD